MNKILLSGRLTKDATINYSTGENTTAVARFNLAVDRKYKREWEQTADFISCVAFGKTAEVIEKYCKQGTKIIVEGRWQTGSYTNREGQKIYTNDCMVENIEFAESKNSGGENNTTPAPKTDADGFMSIPDNVDDDGLPF